jgi:hypothetical protein
LEKEHNEWISVIGSKNKGGDNMRFPKDLSPIKNTTSFQLNKVISRLKEAGDIQGVALIQGNDSILAYDFPQYKNDKADIQNIIKLLKQAKDSNHTSHHKTHLNHNIINYNGARVLAKKLKNNRFLLVMLHKRGYVNFALMDIENSIGMIDEIMKEFVPNVPINIQYPQAISKDI